MKHNWEYKKLGDICQTISGLWTGKNPPFVNVGVIRNTNFTKQCTLNPDNIFYTDVEVKAFAKRKLQKGDIIIEKSGGSEKQPVGRPILFLLDGEFSFSNFTATLRLKDKSISSIFLHKSLTSLYFNGVTRKLQSRTTGLFNLNWKEYLNLRIPVPPLEVQEQIVAELDKINETIEDCRELLRNLDALAQSLFYDFFGDPITNTKGWKSQTLAELCTVTSSNRIFAEEYCDEGIPFYRGKEISELSRGEKISIELFISANRYEKLKSANNVPQINDILITAVGTIGNIWVVDTLSPFYFKDGNIIWLKDINFKVSNSKYFRYLLYRLIDIEKNKMVNGSAYKALTIQNLKKLSVFLPPLSLQEKFAERIEQIETQKKIVESTIAELQTLLDSRMDYWFN